MRACAAVLLFLEPAARAEPVTFLFLNQWPTHAVFRSRGIAPRLSLGSLVKLFFETR
jgi:hypothetical protein